MYFGYKHSGGAIIAARMCLFILYHPHHVCTNFVSTIQNDGSIEYIKLTWEIVFNIWKRIRLRDVCKQHECLLNYWTISGEVIIRDTAFCSSLFSTSMIYVNTGRWYYAVTRACWGRIIWWLLKRVLSRIMFEWKVLILFTRIICGVQSQVVFEWKII